MEEERSAEVAIWLRLVVEKLEKGYIAKVDYLYLSERLFGLVQGRRSEHCEPSKTRTSFGILISDRASTFLYLGLIASSNLRSTNQSELTN